MCLLIFDPRLPFRKCTFVAKHSPPALRVRWLFFKALHQQIRSPIHAEPWTLGEKVEMSFPREESPSAASRWHRPVLQLDGARRIIPNDSLLLRQDQAEGGAGSAGLHVAQLLLTLGSLWQGPGTARGDGYLRPRLAGGPTRKRDSASPRFCRKDSELYTSVSTHPPSGAMGET